MAKENKENQPTESPTLPESSAGETQTKSPEEEAKDLLEELKGFGVESSEQLQNKMTAASQAGNAALILGEVRSENAELKNMMAQLQGQLNATPSQQPYSGEYGEPTVDMSQFATKKDVAAIQKTALREFYTEDILKPQQQAYQANLQQLSIIHSDPDYPLVAEIFERHLANPNTQIRIASGQTTSKDEFDKTVRAFFRESLKRTVHTLEGLTSKSPKPPHIEQGETRSVPLPAQDEESAERVAKIVEDRKSGARDSDASLEALVKEALPADDPIFQM